MTRCLKHVQQLLPALLTTRAASRTICHRHQMSLGPDPRSLCERYTDETYARMRDDHARTCAYEQAIKVVAPGRVCLDIGTGALGLLAVMAARAGAAHVYAIEANAQAYAAAVQTVADLQLSDRVTVIHGYSTDVQLPCRVDLLLHEIFGEIAGAEGVVVAVRDAAKRHLATTTRVLSSATATAATDEFAGDSVSAAESETVASAIVSIPVRARTLLAPAEFPGADYFASLPFPMLAAPGATGLKLPSLPRDVLLAAPQTFEDLRVDVAAPEGVHDVSLEFVLERPGALRGLALHVEVFMTEADASAPDVSSAQPGSHWPNVFMLLSEELQVEAGKRVVVRASARLETDQPLYTFEVEVCGKPVGTLMHYPANLVPGDARGGAQDPGRRVRAGRVERAAERAARLALARRPNPVVCNRKLNGD